MSVKLVCFSCFSNYNTHVSATDMVGKSECLDGLRNCWSLLHHQRIGSLKFKNKRMKKYLTYQEVFTVWDEEIALVKQIFFFCHFVHHCVFPATQKSLERVFKNLNESVCKERRHKRENNNGDFGEVVHVPTIQRSHEEIVGVEKAPVLILWGSQETHKPTDTHVYDVKAVYYKSDTTGALLVSFLTLLQS